MGFKAIVRVAARVDAQGHDPRNLVERIRIADRSLRYFLSPRKSRISALLRKAICAGAERLFFTVKQSLPASDWL